MKISLLSILIMLSFGILHAQNLQISGKVTDSGGIPIPGVNIVENGTTNGTLSDTEGNYSIAIQNDESVLKFSSIGYISIERPVANNTIINVTLEENLFELSEVVVIGYGTIEKKDLTGAISVINTEDFKNKQALSVGEAIQGLAAGVNVRMNGNLGAEPNIKIRGVGNLGNNNPLYVIDGMISTGGMRDLNVNDIESVQILKDASAAAIYGSQAANGVIIITTKKGEVGEMKVDFSMKYGINKLPDLNLMDTADFFRYNDMAYENAGLSTQDHFDNSTDWQDEVLRTGYSSEYNIGISGATTTSSYFISANYFTDRGTTRGTELERYTIRVNTEAKRGIFTLGENFALSTTNLIPSSSGNPIVDVLRMTPDIAVRDSNNPGGYGYGDEARARTFGTNSVAIQDLVKIKSGNTRLRGNVYGEMAILKSLKYRMNVGYETSFDKYQRLRKEGNWTLNQPQDPSHIYENRARFQSLLFENTLSFKKEIKEHAIDVIAGSSYNNRNYEQISGQKSDVFISGGKYIDVLNAGSTNATTGGFRAEILSISYFGRLNYNYKGKYLFSSSIRRDASSQFGPDYRTGYFPSASIGWRISEEDFFKISWLNDLKLRANYGALGNSAFENWGANSGIYDYIPSLTTFPSAVFGTDGEQVILNGASQRELVNEDLTWETKKQTNFGIDFGFIQNRLLISADYFISKTEDVLVEYPIALATGNDGGNPWVNAGTLGNKGFEIEASFRKSLGDFKYTVGANVTKVVNEVLDLPYGDPTIITGLTKSEVGEPLAMFYLIETDGIFQSEKEVQDHKNSAGIVIQPDAQPGDLRYVDADDNGIISAAGDRQILGSPWPKFELGLSFNAEYKNFDFSFHGFGAFGQKIWNGTRALTEQFSDNSNYRNDIDPWTPENTDTDFPRVLYGDSRNSMGDTDRWLEDGSFFKIRNITLGYTLNNIAFIEKYVESLRISISGQNLATFTKYKGLDPEFNNGYILEFGTDHTSYPSPRSLIFSLNARF